MTAVIDSTVPQVQAPINIGFVPPYPVGEPTDDKEGLQMFRLGGMAYEACIIELISVRKQDEERRENARSR